jgi:hypothetical protein
MRPSQRFARARTLSLGPRKQFTEIPRDFTRVLREFGHNTPNNHLIYHRFLRNTRSKATREPSLLSSKTG